MNDGRIESMRRTGSGVALLTMNRRGHWAKDDDLRANWKQWARLMSTLIVRERGPMQTPVKVTVALYWPDNRVRDAGNYMQTGKAIVDGIVQSRLVSDDRDTLVVGPDMRRIPKRADRLQRDVIVIIEETSIEAELASIERAALSGKRN